ncbi:MAG: PIN domain-containing protein [Verrucomicrobiales bacterium]|nr:PIN domain-containing protein [Verrucomicrobiales bacterium]
MVRHVFDSYALLAYLRDEDGADAVQTVLEQASRSGNNVQMCEVNYAEVQYMIRRKHGADAWAHIAGVLPGLPISFVAAGRELSDWAAEFKARHKMSLTDAYAAALAKKFKAELVTGDAEFKPLADEIKIKWLC